MQASPPQPAGVSHKARRLTVDNWLGACDRKRRQLFPAEPVVEGHPLARACHALAEGVAAFGDDNCATAFERAVPWLDEPTPYLDLRAVALLAAVSFAEATRQGAAAERAVRWAQEIYAVRCGGILPDRRGSSIVHLWGHLQECALAEAGIYFRRPEWIEAALTSAERLLIPAVEFAFPALTSIAFDVSCTVRGLEALGTATSDARLRGMRTSGGPGSTAATRPARQCSTANGVSRTTGSTMESSTPTQAPNPTSKRAWHSRRPEDSGNAHLRCGRAAATSPHDTGRVAKR